MFITESYSLQLHFLSSFFVSSEQGAALNAKSYSAYCIVWNILSHLVIVKGQTKNRLEVENPISLQPDFFF